MTDTSPAVMDLFDRLMMERSPEERLRMGCSMFDTAKEIVKSSILAEFPDISEKELRVKIFLRFYASDFDAGRIAKIVNAIRS